MWQSWLPDIRQWPQNEIHLERGGDAQSSFKLDLSLEAGGRNVQFVLTRRKLEESVKTERARVRDEMGVGRWVIAGDLRVSNGLTGCRARDSPGNEALRRLRCERDKEQKA